MRIGFDNDRYLKIQSEHIKERINQFGDKLYLEFGGKLFDDYHASRVLPGFAPDSKLQMLMQLADVAEIVIVISAADIEKNKVRGDLGITYDVDVVRLIGEFEKKGLYVGSVVITQFAGQSGAVQFREKLEKRGIKVYQHYKIEGYPANIPLNVSEKKKKNSLILRSKDGITRIDLQQLEYCEVLGRKLLFHLEDGAVLESAGSLDDLAGQLMQYSNFFRPHRSFLVNMEYIQNISSRSIKMVNDAEIVGIPCSSTMSIYSIVILLISF